MDSKPIVYCLAAGFAASFSLSAQTQTVTGARAEQARTFRAATADQALARQRLAPAIDGEAPSSPGDPDLGEQIILKKREKATPFSLFTDASGYFTTNAALTNKEAIDDYFLVGQVGATYQARIVNDLFGEITVRQAIFKYAELSELDFDSLNLGAGVTYILRPLWGLALSMRYNYNRLTDGEEHEEFFRNQTLTLGMLKSFELSKAHYVFVGYSSILGWSEPVAPQRDEHGFYLGYRLNVTRSVSTDLYYRIALFDYVDGREDLNQNLSVSLRWDIAKWFSISTSASLGLNYSDQEVFDYEVFNTGVGIAASISF